MAEDTKYRWNFTFSWVVEYIRKDAEISIDLDGQRMQKVILKGCESREQAEKVAIDYCDTLSRLVAQTIKQATSGLKDAKE